MSSEAPFERQRGEFVVSTDRARLDVAAIHAVLTRMYWSEGISRDLVATSIEHSLPFGVYAGSRQVGFARVITDHATFAYLADVYVLEETRGRGAGKFLIESILEYPTLGALRRFLLATRDASALYAKYGFAPLKRPEMMMEIGRSARELYGGGD